VKAEQLNKWGVLIFQLSALAVFFGRSWQHLDRGGPYLTLFTNDLLFRPLVELFSEMSWSAYIRSSEVATFGKNVGYGMGYFFGIAVIWIILYQWIPRWINRLVTIITTIALFILALTLFQQQAFRVAQFFEYTCQISTPFLFYHFFYNQITKDRLQLLLKIIIALTFISHGLYAIGYYPIPGKFIGMTNRGFGSTDEVSRLVLLTVGWLDIILSLALFLPLKKIQTASIIYMIIWGILTAFARIWANYYHDLGWYSLNQWIPETIYRFPHFLLPLALLLFSRQDVTK